MAKAQSAVEYLATYGWAILITAVITIILYLYVSAPKTIVPASCVFISGVYCNAMVVGSSPSTHATTVALFLTNSQPYPIASPAIFAQIGGANTTHAACSPNYVIQSGSMICILSLQTRTTLGQFMAGKLYLNATYCGLNPNYSRSNLCGGAPTVTYSGKFQSHVEPLVGSNVTMTLIAKNSTALTNNAKDQLIATVYLLGYPLRGATVNFTANVPGYNINPNYTTANTTGKVLSYIWGTRAGNVLVTASYAGYSANTVVQFSPAVTVRFSTNWPYCSSAGQMITIDGIAYTCQQMTSAAFTWGSNTVHSCNVNNIVSASTGIRGICSLSSGTPGACIGNPNVTYTVNCSSQYYLTMSASPSNGGAVSPSSGWYNQSSAVGISQTADPGFNFNGWTGSGTISYTGTSSSGSVVMNSPVSETSAYTTNVVFTEAGLGAGTSWAVTLNGNTVTSTGATIAFTGLAAGTYTWSTAQTVSCGTGCRYAAATYSGSVSTTSGSAQQQVSYGTQYYLTMSAATGGAASPSSGWYSSGAQVAITATPSSGYYFQSWAGTGSGSYTGTSSSATVTLNGPISETPAFSNARYLTMIAGAGGSVSPSSGLYPSGSVVAITATASSGYKFSGWTGTGSGSYSGSYNPTTVTVNANITETASFTQVPGSYYWVYSTGYNTGHSYATFCDNYFYSQPNCQGSELYSTGTSSCWDVTLCNPGTGPASCPGTAGQCYYGSIGSCNPYGPYWTQGCSYPNPCTLGGQCLGYICYPTQGCINT